MDTRDYRSEPCCDYYGYYGRNASTPEVNALTVFLLGIGVLALVVGAFTDLFSLGLGFVGLVAAWVLGLTLRVYMVGSRSYRQRED